MLPSPPPFPSPCFNRAATGLLQLFSCTFSLAGKRDVEWIIRRGAITSLAPSATRPHCILCHPCIQSRRCTRCLRCTPCHTAVTAHTFLHSNTHTHALSQTSAALMQAPLEIHEVFVRMTHTLESACLLGTAMHSTFGYICTHVHLALALAPSPVSLALS